jgi:mono/diheme cytochrome c family protein
MNTLKTSLLIVVLLIISLSFTSLKGPANNEILTLEQPVPDSSNWIAPASADELINPIEVSEESIAQGSAIYKRNCRSCHGRNGDGQGVEAAELSTPATDFTNPSFIDQTDGSMYWKISEGRNDMEAFKNVIEEDEVWNVVIYIKTLAEVKEE